VSAALRHLAALQGVYGGDTASRRLLLLQQLARQRQAYARAVQHLHEQLCFLRAYPDDGQVLAQVEAMLAGFAARGDLRRHRRELADTGIAGTDIYYRFFWFTAEWLARRWPHQITIDWRSFENRAELEALLRLLVPYAEAAALDHAAGEAPVPGTPATPRQWLARLAGSGTTDATFLIRRFAALPVDRFTRELLYERLDPMLRLAAGPETPSRTAARVGGLPVVFRTRPLDRARPDLRRAILEVPRRVQEVSPRLARTLIDCARESMVTRSRDLDSFEHADPADVRVVDAGDGLQFACIGMVPERRALLDTIYGYLTLQNGVPIGYVLSSTLFGSALVAYNIFETFRGGEAARNYGRVLAMVRDLFGCDTFAVDPYQLGHDNAEGLASGAWWFYSKLGFRPVERDVLRLVRAEQARLRADPRHRSSRATLQKLSAAPVFFHLQRPRTDVLGRLALGNVSLAVADFMARQYGADREGGLQDCSTRAARLLGAGSRRGFSAGQRLAWERWAPLVLLLPGVERWSASERAALVRVIRAKGGPRESDFVRLFDAHRRLRQAVLALARPRPSHPR